MKKFLLFLFVGFVALFARAQQWAPVDKSPLDQVYYPHDYPHARVTGKVNEPLRLRVIYSRPNKSNRQIFGSDMVPYGKVWRMGANEATEIQLFTDAKIAGKKIPAGRYTLYALVDEKNWTFIINKETDIWGAFKYDPAKDVCRFTTNIKKLEKPVEALTIDLEKSAIGANLSVAWDTSSAMLPVSF